MTNMLQQTGPSSSAEAGRDIEEGWPSMWGSSWGVGTPCGVGDRWVRASVSALEKRAGRQKAPWGAVTGLPVSGH